MATGRASGNAAAVRILVVDDEPSVVEFVEKVLRIDGYTTMSATSGEAAIALCEQRGFPALLLTDLKMPRMDGDVLADRLRSREPGMKVLYLTGYAPQLFRRRRALTDGEAVLEKPCTIDALLAAVSLLLAGATSTSARDT